MTDKRVKNRSSAANALMATGIVWLALALAISAPASAQNTDARPAPSTITGQGSTTPSQPSLPPQPGNSLISAETAPEEGLPHDLSPWGMFMAADWVVKAVMIGLAFASVVTWTVWIAKSAQIGAERTRLRKSLREIAQASSLVDATQRLRGQTGPGADLVRGATEEVQSSEKVVDYGGEVGLKERVGSRLTRIQTQAGRNLTRGTGLLATIGSTAPFVGLFGTVWGIMNAFIGISEAQTTNLAVVAPGIAEALLATALGLVAAIPAVVIYNMFARTVSGYRQSLADAAAAIERLVSLDLDVRRVERAIARATSSGANRSTFAQ